MKNIYFLCFLFFVFKISTAQDISSLATTTNIEFTNANGFISGNYLANQTGWMGSTNWKSAQAIYAGQSAHRITVKRQYQRHQKNQLLQADAGKIITLKMIFKPSGTANSFDAVGTVAAGQLFAFGLKSVFDASNTQSATDLNGELIGIEIDASNHLGIQYIADAATQAYNFANWNTLTIKYFVGNAIGSSRIKAKLDHGSGDNMVTSGWLNKTWDCQALYDAVTGSGAYMMFQSGTGLGTDTTATQVYIDSYSFYDGNDNGQIHLSGGITSPMGWSNNSLPTSSSRVFFMGTNPTFSNGGVNFAYDYMYVSSNSTANITKVSSLTLNSLDVDGNLNVLTFPDDTNTYIENNLTINSELEVDGTLEISSGSSLIVAASGTSSGSITYTRNLATTNWYLISSPVSGQDIDTFVSAEGLASGSGNNNMGLAAYDNSSSAWSYYQSGASGSGDFALGSGRSIKLSTAGDISFTGTMPVDDVSIAITNGYNLVGNPYPSYIAANTAADSSDNILTTNSSSLSEQTLWMWNQATSSYDAINQASNSMDIAPAQGFFVKTSGSNTLSITEAMQSHQSSDSFQRLSNERPEISLVLSDGENTRDTDIYYIDGTTTGFDNGYDSTTFSGAANSFSIYTHLVANSNGEDFAIQSLPNSSLETMIIPVGITAAAGEQLSISANAINLPEGVNIYLEDKSDDSFTLLDSTSTFTTTPDEDLNGIGRFYIHTTATALSDNQVSLTNVSMYVVDSSLTITGVHTANASVRVYDLVGKEVVNTSFEGTGLNKIELPVLTTGVYVVQLETQTEAVNKKIIIKK